MKYLRYFFEFLFTIIIFIIFKILGPKISSDFGGFIFERIGPFFRKKELIHSNIKKAFPNIDNKNLNKIYKSMWNNYGRIFAEYIFIKEFRYGKLNSKIHVVGQEILEEIKKSKNRLFLSQDI